MDEKLGAVFASIIAAMVAAWTAFRRQRQLDRDSTIKHWKWVARDLRLEVKRLEDERDELQVKNAELMGHKYTDVITINALQLQVDRYQDRFGPLPDTGMHQVLPPDKGKS